jgi:hypothetical protein
MNHQQELELDFVMRLRCPDRSHHYYAEVYHLGRLKNKETWYVWVPLKKNKQCGMKELKQTYEAFVKDVKEKTKEQIRKRIGTPEVEPEIDVLVDAPVFIIF